jgi:uncharacterized protein (TIGR02145 family)
MNKLYIIAVFLMGFTSIQGQITEMIIYETGGNTVTYQIANIDSIVYDTTAIATCPATFTDARDNEVYAVVQIGNQCWMAENLRYNASGSYLNSANPSTTYGRLYDWATVMNGATTSSSNPSGVQGICPSGWHLPSDAEWNELEMALGMPAVDTANTGYRGTHGTGMKSTTGWINSGNGTNVSGFNAFPAGYYYSGSFNDLGVYTYFWSSTEYSPTSAWNRNLFFGITGVYRYNLDLKTIGFSCRCTRD